MHTHRRRPPFPDEKTCTKFFNPFMALCSSIGKEREKSEFDKMKIFLQFFTETGLEWDALCENSERLERIFAKYAIFTLAVREAVFVSCEPVLVDINSEGLLCRMAGSSLEIFHFSVGGGSPAGRCGASFHALAHANKYWTVTKCFSCRECNRPLVWSFSLN